MFRVAAFVGVAAIYIGARFWDLTATCLWFDEIFSVHATEHSWDSILNFVALDLIHPPLFYLLLKIWLTIGGETLFWLRLLPVLFSILAIVPLLLFCRELRLSYWTAILAFFLLAVNGSLIKYAQEVRMYSMLLCMSLVSMWLFARYFNKGKGIVALTLVNIILVYTHYFGWFVVLSEVVAILALQRIKWRPVIVMLTVSAVCFLPWVVAVLSAARSGSELSQNIGWMQRPGVIGVVQLALSLVEPSYYPATSIDPMSVYRVSVPILLICAIAIVVFLVNANVLRRENRQPVKQLMIFLIVPMVATFIVSWVTPYSIWGTRHLIILFGPFALLAAMSISHIPHRALKTAVVTLVVLFSGYAFVIEAGRTKKPPVWCGFEVLAEKLQAAGNGPINVFEDLAAYHLWFAFRNYPDLKFRQCVVKVDGFPGMVEDKAYFIPRGIDDGYLLRGKLQLDSAPSQMWIVYRAPKLDITAPPLSTFSDRGFLIKRQEIYDSDESKIIAVFLVKQ